MRSDWGRVIAIGMLFILCAGVSLVALMPAQVGWESAARAEAPEGRPGPPVIMRVTLGGAEPWVFVDPYILEAVRQAVAEMKEVDTEEEGPSGDGSTMLIEIFDSVTGDSVSVLFEDDWWIYDQQTGGAMKVEGREAIEWVISGNRMAIELYLQMQEDGEYDGHSVFWDGLSAYRGADIGDIPIELALQLDPEGSIVELKTHTVLNNLSLECPIWPEYIHEDSESRYEASDATWFFLAEKGPDLLDAYEANDALVKLDTAEMQSGASLHVFQGIFNCEGLCYAGYAVVMVSKGDAYAVSLGGIGSMRDVRSMAGYLYESLDIYSETMGLI